jgi:hypothetical protein
MLLKDHLPEIGKEDTVDMLDFVGTIIDSMNRVGKSADFTTVVIEMSGKELSEIQNMPVEKVIGLFVSNLIENKVFEFRMFVNQIDLV